LRIFLSVSAFSVCLGIAIFLYYLRYNIYLYREIFLLRNSVPYYEGDCNGRMWILVDS